MQKGRIEAFSDGVMGVAITLLVLDLHLDVSSSTGLASQLRERWPSFAAYVMSFFVIGAIWLNHYHLFRLATDIDHHVMIYNLLLLLFVTTIPFTTAAYAGYLLEGADDARLAVILYCAVMEGAAISLMLMLERLLRAGLVGEGLSSQQIRLLRVNYLWRIAVYLMIMAVGLVKPLMMLVMYVVIIAVRIRPLLKSLKLDTLPGP